MTESKSKGLPDEPWNVNTP